MHMSSHFILQEPTCVFQHVYVIVEAANNAGCIVSCVAQTLLACQTRGDSGLLTLNGAAWHAGVLHWPV